SAQMRAQRGVDLLPDDANDTVRIDHLKTLAAASDLIDKGKHYAAALQIAIDASDHARCVTMFNNLAYTAWRRQESRLASDYAEQMIATATAHNITLTIAQRETLAQVHLMNRRYDEARAVLTEAVTWDPPGVNIPDGAGLYPSDRHLIEALTTLATTY